MTSSPDPETLTGYPSRWAVRAGDTIEFMISAGVPSYQAEVLRVTGRGPQPDEEAPPLSFERVRAEHPEVIHRMGEIGGIGVHGDPFVLDWCGNGHHQEADSAPATRVVARLNRSP